MGAVVLRNLIGEISAPPSAITPFASSNEIFFGGRDAVICWWRTTLVYLKAGRW